MPHLNPDQLLAVSQLIGGLAGALTGQGGQGVYIGAGGAGNAVANNRLLHPSERALAQRLFEKAQKDGLPYTLGEIEAQMRLMGNVLYSVEPNHAEVYANTTVDATAFQALQASLAQDPTMPKGVNGGTVFEVLGTNAAIQSFVTASTMDGAGYIPGISPYLPSNTGYGDVPGSPPSVSTAPCANMNLGCASGVGNQQNTPLTPAQQQAIGAYFGKAGTDYQRAAAIATAAGNAPVALSFEIAAGVAGLLEQAFSPSVGKVMLDSALVDSVAKAFSDRTGIPILLVNEVAEREIKPRLQSGRNSIDQFTTVKK